MPTKKELKALDAKIETVFAKVSKNVLLDIFDVAKVFEVGRKANDEGRDMKAAIIDFIQKVRKDKKR